MTTATLLEGNCLDQLRTMADESVHAIVTDPPYGLANTDPTHVVEALTAWASGDREFMPKGRGFMGNAWDAFVPPPAVWDECMRVLKPGGHLLAFAGSRTFDLMTLSVRFAGFDNRDSIAWLYGSGFPKSMDVSKAIDKLDATAERLERARTFQAWLSPLLTPQQVNALTGTDMGHHLTTHPSHPAVATADIFDKLRPELPEVPEAIEDLVAQRTVESRNFKAREVVGVRSMVDTSKSRLGFAGATYGGTGATREVAETSAHTDEARAWQGWGTALKPGFEPIVVAQKPIAKRVTVAANVLEHGTGALNIDATRIATDDVLTGSGMPPLSHGGMNSRPFHEEHVATPTVRAADGRFPANVMLDESQAAELDLQTGTLTSGKMRAGTPRSTRQGAALGEMPAATGRATIGDSGGASRFFYVAKAPKSERPVVDGAAHPTVKPLTLIRQLIKLVTPPGGIVVDPFAGSGTTMEAALLEGFDSVGIEMTDTYWPLIRHRIDRARAIEAAA